jgi:shikimate kinase
MNIVLTGMRGSGKTTVAKLLAKKLHLSFYDLDILLTEKEKMPISDVVKLHGWDYFRDKESEIAEKVSQKTNAVIATGGGVILRKQNIAALKKNGTFVFLKTSVDEMIKRIGFDKNRPPLTIHKTLKEELEEVWRKRKDLYEKTADITIETDNKTVAQIVEAINNNVTL